MGPNSQPPTKCHPDRLWGFYNMLARNASKK
jgi:hypothetical protein